MLFVGEYSGNVEGNYRVSSCHTL